jgi:dTMP kinase
VNRGRLIVFEGLDGAGKSTQLRRLAVALRARGHVCIETHEPTDGPLGRRIREHARAGPRVTPEVECSWFIEDRREHVRDVIEPALAAGQIALCDRYTLSTVAYQGARGLDWRRLLAQAEREFPLPDLVLLFEIDPSIGLARVDARGAPRDQAFERVDYLREVARIFAALGCRYLARIDAARGEDAVFADVRSEVARRLGLAVA